MVASGPSSNYDEADFNHGLLDLTHTTVANQGSDSAVTGVGVGFHSQWFFGSGPRSLEAVYDPDWLDVCGISVGGKGIYRH